MATNIYKIMSNPQKEEFINAVNKKVQNILNRMKKVKYNCTNSSLKSYYNNLTKLINLYEESFCKDYSHAIPSWNELKMPKANLAGLACSLAWRYYKEKSSHTPLHVGFNKELFSKYMVKAWAEVKASYKGENNKNIDNFYISSLERIKKAVSTTVENIKKELDKISISLYKYIQEIENTPRNYKREYELSFRNIILFEDLSKYENLIKNSITTKTTYDRDRQLLMVR